MEIQLNITGKEYYMLMRMINHEANDNSYMLCRAKAEKRLACMKESIEQNAKDIKAFKTKVEEAYNEAFRRCPAVNEMA